MLLYYFNDKTEIIAAVLQQISEQLVEMLGARMAAQPLPLDALRRSISSTIFVDEFWPYMRIWLEVASRAAMGDPFYRTVGEQIGRGFFEWGKMQIAAETDAQRDVDAARLLVSIEGMLFLKSLGLDDINDLSL